jgi:predicted nucleotidyltransferase component of viral defense system
MKDSRFYSQVALLLRVLPLISDEKNFALKGGTAINLFVRDMPRLSVDIDLTFLPVTDRETAFAEIGNGIRRLKDRIERTLPGVRATPIQIRGATAPTSMSIESANARIRVEVNFVLRGTVFGVQVLPLCESAQEDFGLSMEVQTLSKADLFGGKICAALDRQHPRDLFDIKLLLSNEGITDDIRKAFVVYLASHSRPMNEVLRPNWKNLEEAYERDFRGMTKELVSVEELIEAREELHRALIDGITKEEQRFLLSLKEGSPEWNALGLPGVERLPGIQWKLNNIRMMSAQKRDEELKKLTRVFEG